MLYLPSNLFLGVNIDHVATVRQARGTLYPSPVLAGLQAEQAGADAITLHLREDRRHIQDQDVIILRKVLTVRMNLEMATTPDMIAQACRIKPADCCLVPERRAELTTEGGLDVASDIPRLVDISQQLKDAGIRVSLFIDPDPRQVEAATAIGVPVIEIHTGRYADTEIGPIQDLEYRRIQESVYHAKMNKLQVNAGHGLNYHNVGPIAALTEITELNIGHAIIAQAVFVGLREAVSTMKRLILEARYQSKLNIK